MAYLQALSNSKSLRVIEISEPKFVLGRSSDCNLWDIFGKNDTVSHHHARIDKVGNQFALTDTDSHNGTRINDQPVKPRQPRVLSDGDIIAICKWKFRFLTAIPKGTENGDTKGDSTPYGESSVESRISVDSDGSSSSQNTTSAAIRLKAILGVLTALGPTLDLADLLSGLLTEVLKVFPGADACRVCLLSQKDDSLDADTVAVIHRDSSKEPSHLSKTILAEVLRTKHALLFSDRHLNPIFQDSETVRERGLRSAMCVPLMAEGEVVGVMQVDTHRQKERFRNDDLEVLTSIAPMINLAIRHSQLHERELTQRAMEYEMAAAQRVQLSLLPRHTPAIAGYEFFAHYNAALQVGGDYYDYIALPDGRIAVVLADASGKGTSAALYMSAVSGELKCSLFVEKSTTAALGRLNRWICDN
ncbi:MAG: GAF domain-containing protein, partial [Planctomycetales bacterium]|nr:GAF domain-containing protein [Planctomycetales bacterium]